MNPEDDYIKIDVVAVNNDMHNLTGWLKNQITDKNRVEFNRYVTKMYLDIDKEHKSVTVSFPTYDEEQIKEYVEGLITSAMCIGYEVYVKEQNNGK